MKLLLKVTVSIVAVLLVIPAGYLAVVFIGGVGMCGNHVHAEYPSPGGSLKVVVFQRDCGATTGFSTQISIFPSNKELGNSSGDIYIIDGHPENVAPSIEWMSENIVAIKTRLNGSEYKAETSWGSVNKIEIEYDEGGS